MALLDSSQIDKLQQARIGALGFTAVGTSTVVTSTITTALTNAGDNNATPPLQVFTTSTVGVVTTGSDNLVLIISNTTKKPLADASGNEVYGRLTEAAGVYTLTYYSLISGTETAYTFASTAIDFFFCYQFDFTRMPRNAGVSLTARIVQNDPSGSTGSLIKTEKLTVTATNTLSGLTAAPTTSTSIQLLVNGKVENPFGGGSAAFSVSSQTVTWSATNAKYAILTTFDVVAIYW